MEWNATLPIPSMPMWEWKIKESVGVSFRSKGMEGSRSNEKECLRLAYFDPFEQPYGSACVHLTHTNAPTCNAPTWNAHFWNV